MPSSLEVNLDGIVGPTHHYGGLAVGNLASMTHRHFVSNPKQAALQGLDKMRQLIDLGLSQVVFPPHERPFLPFLRAVGFTGKDADIVQQVFKYSPEILTACSSSANMWMANAATVCPSIDTIDGKVHFLPANLVSQLHRSFEAPTTALVLKRIFSDPQFFVHHSPLPSQDTFSDEGAANHTRFCSDYDQKGVHLFVFGRRAKETFLHSQSFPRRQTLEASEAVARLLTLSEEQTIFAQQNPEAINQGVFHNDVISVGNQFVFFYHEKAFLNTPQVIKEIRDKLKQIHEMELFDIPVYESQVSLKEAVHFYLFNSQLVTLKNQQMALIAPSECQHSSSVQRYLNELVKRTNHPIKQIVYSRLKESMQNGGGPACLRLRIVLTPQEYEKMLPSVRFTPELHRRLVAWVNQYYRDRLTLSDLADSQLLLESQQALDALTSILHLGSIYSFQQSSF
jgi:succinylarginine dihydrolase